MEPEPTFNFLIPLVASLLLLSGAFWIWMLVDCLMHETDKAEKRFKWCLGIALTSLFGAALYLFNRKLPRKKLS